MTAEFTNVKLPPSGEESDHIRSSAPEVKKPSEAEQQVLAGVEDVLRINQRLERSHMGTLEYAEVSLDTGNSVPINRRQYPLAHNLLPRIEEVVRKWLSEGCTCRV